MPDDWWLGSDAADDVSVPASMWTPDVTQKGDALMASTHVALPDLAAVKAWSARLNSL